jgi:cellulose synthase/poly-beta-1,6-N-acetylglucosamine synthase-like glycosyltransferase
MWYGRSAQGNLSLRTFTRDADNGQQVNIMRYAEWLSRETRRSNSVGFDEENNKYTEDSLKPIMVGGQEVRLFAPFLHTLSAHRTLTSGQTLTLGTIALTWLLGLLFFGVKLLTATLAVLILLYFGTLLVNFWLSTRTLAQSSEEQIDDAVVHALVDADWPRYTILCPLYHEAEVVPQFVQAMLHLDYPIEKLEILLLTEEDDTETRNAIEAMRLPAHFSIVTVPPGVPRTKPRACNFGLLQATGDYVVIYDIEDIPDPLQLKKAVLTFANHGADLACVQAKLNYYNAEQNLLTRWFTVEYSLWFDLILPGMQHTGLPLPLGGTSNHFRTQTLRLLGAWDAFNVTEDCDLGLRMARSHFKTAMLDSTTYEEANSRVKNWLRQRSRWIKGYMQTYLVHMRLPFYYLHYRRLREFLSLQLVIGGKTAVLFVNPMMWLLLVVYILFRPLLGGMYHMLFPAPILYMGTLCLIFGNFFYAYSHLVGCLKRGQYGLIKWALFIPIYWMMISVAAFIAFFQLIFKPHYWEKTQHGFHLPLFRSPAPIIVKKEEGGSMTTLSLPAPSHVEGLPIAQPVILTAERLRLDQPKHQIAQHRLKDPWLIATLIVACIASIASCWYFFQNHQILLYADAISHLRIARRVVDNTSPGLAQLGGVWLPLPHILMLPFIWNNYLWRTGLAGSFPAMFCYIVAVVYLFLSARRLTRDSRASFVGTLLFILNPNILYLQTTPLSEIVCVATSVMACYYFLAWSLDNHPKDLVGVAASTFLVTLSRYDGWGLFLTLMVLLVIMGWIKRQRWVQIEGNLLVFGVLGSLGVALWFLWCAVIFGDPLYFHNYLFSAAANTSFYTYHDLRQSVLTYMFTSMQTVGPLLFFLTVIAVLVFVFRLRHMPNMFGAVAFLTPFAFYILVFYTGQDTIYLPGIGPAGTPSHFWNVRFGAEAVAPIALFLAVLAMPWSITRLAPLWTVIQQIVLVIAIGIQTLLVAHGGIISLQDGVYGGSCQPTEEITIYLAQHYAGGRILEDVNDFNIAEADIGIDLKDAIYEGSGEVWQKALKDPSSVVDWIIVPTNKQDDLIARHIDLESPAFLSRFTLVIQQPYGLQLRLYHRNGRSPLPTRPIPSSLITDHRLCKA